VETTLLQGLLLLQWADSLPTGSAIAEAACSVACTLSTCALQAVSSMQSSLAVLPAGSAQQMLLLPLSMAMQQLEQQQQQQQQQQPEKQQQEKQQQQKKQQQEKQQQEKQCQFLVVMPTSVVAEMLPLLIKLCKARLLLLDSDQQQQHGPNQSPTVPHTASSAQTRDTVCRLARLVSQLHHLSVIEVADCVRSSSTAGSCSPHSGAGTAAAAAPATNSNRRSSMAVPACCSPAVPYSILHSRDVFAAHAVDSIATLEAVLRITIRTAVWRGIPDATKPLRVVDGLSAVAVLLGRQAGPGSAALQQCHSFLASLLRLATDPALSGNQWLCCVKTSCYQPHSCWTSHLC
jgi:hypothetical protein